jgi:hypothetical protein
MPYLHNTRIVNNKFIEIQLFALFLLSKWRKEIILCVDFHFNSRLSVLTTLKIRKSKLEKLIQTTQGSFPPFVAFTGLQTF